MTTLAREINQNTGNLSIEEVVKAVMLALNPQVTEPEPMPEPVKIDTGFEEYPEILQAKHVRAILGLSEAKTYEVLNSRKCPSFTVGKRILVRKKAFIDYLESSDNQDLIK